MISSGYYVIIVQYVTCTVKIVRRLSGQSENVSPIEHELVVTRHRENSRERGFPYRGRILFLGHGFSHGSNTIS